MTRHLRPLLLALVFALPIVSTGLSAMADGTSNLDPENTLIMKLKTGDVIIQMRPDLAPKTCARIKQLVREHFYDGLTFHRVIAGFMAQTGDPNGDGTGGSGQTIDAEFTDTPYIRGTVGMARTSDPNSADSQFFITFQRTPSLDGQYTVWAQVVKGMTYVDEIKKGDPNRNGMVTDPDHIITLRVMADVEKGKKKKN